MRDLAKPGQTMRIVQFDDLRVGAKLQVLTALTIVLISIAGAGCVKLVQTELLSARINQLRAITDTAKGIADGLQKKVAAGEMSKDAALSAFSDRVRTMSYDQGQGYVFAYRMDGVAVAVPNSAQLGTNRLDAPVNGKPVIRNIRDAVQAKGAATIYYDFPRPGAAKASPKVSYAEAFPDWDLFIGTGSYIDDIDAQMAGVVMGMVVGILLLGLLIAGLAVLIARRITKPLGQLQHCMAEVSKGDHDFLTPGLARKDDIGEMARAVEAFRLAGIEKVRLEAEAEVHHQQAAERLAQVEAAHELSGKDQKLVVSKLAQGLRELAKGKLRPTIVEFFPESYKSLRMDFNQALSELSSAMLDIRDSSNGVARSADVIADGSAQLAQRAEHQAAMLEETAAAHDQITATVQKTLQASKDAVFAIKEAKSNAENSREVVDKAVDAIRAIEKLSEQIGAITSVIDGLAFQTNLLALNAGVEAARAGESGRGFAVVALEVRALAQRSAEAAKQIRDLTGQSAKAVESGVKLVTSTGANLHWIVDQVADVSRSVEEISASAQEQALALQEVNQAISQLDSVTQQNAHVADLNAKACSDLTSEAVRLAELVEHFSVDEPGQGAARSYAA